MPDYQVTAKNYSESSENRIHSDEIAKKFGFRGALVPGVAVYGHLVWPLVDMLGEQWLSHSSDSVRLFKPAYHDDQLTMSVNTQTDAHTVQCHNGHGELLAQLESTPNVPEPEYLDLLNNGTQKPADRVEITWNTVAAGDVFEPRRFDISAEENARYASEVADENPIYQELAHPHLLLSQANTALTHQYFMPTWIHVGSETRHRALLRVGDRVEVRCVTLDKWQRKGHEFIKLWVTYWRGSELTTDILHTAIFKVAT